MSRRVPEGTIVVDASFVIGVLTREPTAIRFAAVLERAVIVDVNLGEVFYRVDQRMAISPQDVVRPLAANGLRVVPLGFSGASRFPGLNRKDLARRSSQPSAATTAGAVRSLSLADMACLATAVELELPVLTGDGQWLTLDVPVRIVDFHDPKLTL